MGKSTAIILAGGKGTRMGVDIPKQYIDLNGYPVLYYAIKAFEESFIDEIILVSGKDYVEYCKKEIVEKYGFKKVKAVIEGGKERYHSVYNGLNQVEQTDYVYIHDGARPFVTKTMLEDIRNELENSETCVVGMPVKDTIKIINDQNEVTDTPERKYVWMVHTPQSFSYKLIKEAYDRIMQQEDQTITDDAMVVEKAMGYPVKIIEGSYKNIKITTPEDLEIAKLYLK